MGALAVMIRRAALLLCVAAIPAVAQVADPDPSLTGPPLRFSAELSPDEESHVTHSPASGRADFTLERETLKLSWQITFRDLTSPPTAANAHGPQTPGGNAGVLFSLGAAPLKSPLAGSVILTEGQLDYLLTGRVYVNILTTRYPDGELRGQIMRVRVDRPTQ
jgi:hypothetical protein